MRKISNAVITTGLAGLLLSCSSAQKQNDKVQAPDYKAIQKAAEAFIPAIGKSGGEIVLSTISDPKSFNPITSTESSTSEFTQYIYGGLVRLSGVTLLPEPNLADRWEISPDGLTWTFHIRPGVRWSDNIPFSAFDVAFTFNKLIFNESIDPNSSRDVFMINGRKFDVTALDSSTVKFVLPEPFAPFLRSMTQEILPQHTCEKYVAAKTFSTALSIQTPPDSMVGTGPFLIESYISSQKVVFKKNPNYWEKDSSGNQLPYLDRIIYTIVIDQNAEVLRFQRGEIDYLAARGEDYPSLKKDEQNGNYTVYRLGPAHGSNFLFFNQNQGVDKKTNTPYVKPFKLRWFSDVQFRRAIAYGLDKQSMINIVLNGLGYPQWSSMASSEGFFFTDSVTKYPYDPVRAKRLLAEAGYKDINSDSILEDSEGHPVEFSFITNSGNNTRVKIAEIIRKDLEQLGFKVHFAQIEFNSLIQKLDNPPFAWDAILLGLTGGSEPHHGRNVWHSSSGLHMWYPNQPHPATPWEARIDTLFDQGVRELDVQKRKAIYDEWQRIVADQLPLIYTVLPEQILCISTKFGNINPTFNGGLLHNIERIYRR